MRRFVASLTAVAGLALAVVLSSCPPVQAQGLREVEGVVPAKVATSLPVGYLDPNTKLHFTIGLSLHNQTELGQLLKNLQDPLNPQFHKWLTPEQFGDQFGPTPADYAKLTEWADAQGFAVVGTFSKTRNVLDLQATVPVVEKAFGIREALYHDANGRLFYAPDRKPTVSVDLPDFSGIQGLDTAEPAHSNLIYKSQLPADPSAAINPLDSPTGPPPNTTKQGNGPGPAFTPSDERSLYGIPNGAGAGQYAGIVALGTVLASDINFWENYYGVTTPWTEELLDGQVQGTSGDGENTLDTETVLGVAPGLTGVILYSNGNSTVDYAQALSENRIDSISNSYGYGESQTEIDEMQQAAAQGITVCVATGDSGSWTVGSGDDPADDPNVEGVGGTSVYANPTNPLTYNWEECWSGSGGGVTNRALPAFQDNLDFSAYGGVNSGRNLPDVAMPADPYNAYSCYLNGNWGGIGGTSWAAPGFNAVMADIAAVNGNRSGCINTLLYGTIAPGSEYATAFNDIEAGSNGGYSAVAGYDLTTGWGSPQFSGLAAAIARGASGIPWAPGLTATPNNKQVALAWTSSVGATSYNVYRGTTSGGESSTPLASGLTSTSYTDTAVTNGTTYYYTVKALNSLGTSGPSVEASATPNIPGAYNVYGINTLNTPAINGGVDTGGFIYESSLLGTSVTWNGQTFTFGPANQANCWSQTSALVSGAGTLYMLAAGVDGSQSNQTFTVTYTDGSTSTFTQSLSDWCNPQSFTGETTVVSMANRLGPRGEVEGPGPNVYGYSATLTAGKMVKSVTLPNNRDVVVLAFATSSSTPVPAAPTNLTAVAGSAQVALSWTASTLATSYNVYRGTTAGGESTTPIATGVTTTSFTDTSVTNGTAYYYTVAGVDSAGAGPSSNEASATPSLMGYNVEGIYTEGTSTVNGGIDTVGYGLDANLLGTSTTWNGLPFTFGPANALDCWSSTTVSISGTGNVYMLAIGVEGAQTNQTFTVTYTDGTTSTFTQSLSDWCNSQAFTGESIVVTMASRLWATGAVVGPSPDVYGYTFPLTAGKTAKSITLPNNRFVVALALAAGAPVPAAPTGLTATAGNTNAALSWNASTGATSYNVYRGMMSGGENAAPVASGLTGTVFTNTGLTNGNTYYYTVKAVDATGPSPASNEASATPAGSSLEVSSITISPSKLTGGTSTIGTVKLNGLASTATTVDIVSSDPAASIPNSVVVPAGSSSAPFTIDTTPVAVDTTLTISGSLTGSADASASMTVRAPALTAVSFSPKSISGGGKTNLTVTLGSAAPAGGISVAVAFTNASALVNPPSTVFVDAGATTGAYRLTASTVTADTSVIASGALANITKSATVTIEP